MSATRSVPPVVRCTTRPPRALVRLQGEFDLSIRDHLADVLACLRLGGCSAVEVDAHEVTFVDAGCLRVLHTEAERLTEAGGALRLVAASSLFVRVVEVAGYPDLLPAARHPGAAHPEPDGSRPAATVGRATAGRATAGRATAERFRR